MIANVRWLVLVALFLSGFVQAAPPAELPGDSVYQLSATLTDQDNQAMTFASLRGRPRIVSMFYTSCPYMCPLIIDTLRMSERELDADQRARLSVLLISLDTKRDGPTELKALVEKRKIDTSRWTLARTDAAHVRKLAALFNIQYRELDNGEFNHTSALLLLDTDGRIVARTETMGKLDEEFVAALKRVLGSP